MSCRIEIINKNEKLGVTENGAPSKLFKSLEKLTSNEEAARAYVYQTNLKNIERDAEGDGIIYTLQGLPVYKTKDSYNAAFPKGVYTESMVKLYNKLEGITMGESDKQIKTSKNAHKIIKEMFTTTALDQNEAIVSITKPGQHFYSLTNRGNNDFNKVFNAVRTFLLANNINIQNIESYLTNIGYRIPNANGIQGIADLANRIIAIQSNSDGSILTEEVGHFVEALYADQTAVLKAHDQVVGTRLWNLHKDSYMAKYNGDIAKVKKEIFGKYVGEAIMDNINSGKVPAPKGMKAIMMKLVNFFKKLITPNFLQTAKEMADAVTEYKSEEFNDTLSQDLLFNLDEENLLTTITNGVRRFNKTINERMARTAYKKVKNLAINLSLKAKEGAIQEGLLLFIEHVNEDTKEVYKAIKNKETLTDNQIARLDNMIRYYRPYIEMLSQAGELKEFKEDKKKVRKLLNKIQARFKNIDTVKQELEANIIDTKLEAINKDNVSIKSLLNKLTNDISSIALWAQPLKDSSSVLLRLLHKLLKDITNKVERDSINFAREFSKVVGDVKDLTFMYEKYNGKRTNYILSERNQAQYDIEFNKFRSQMHEKYELSEDIDEREVQKEQMSDSQLKSYKLEYAMWFKNNTEVKPNIQEIINEAKSTLGVNTDAYKVWKDKNMPTNDFTGLNDYRGELVRPNINYINADYFKLEKKQKEILDFIVNAKNIADSYVGGRKGIMPQIVKNSEELILTRHKGLFNAVKNRVKDALVTKIEDEELFGFDKIYRPDGSTVSLVPKMYTRLQPADTLTDDVFLSIVEFNRMAINYKEMSTNKDFFDILLNRFGATAFNEGKKADSSNTYKAMKGIIDSMVYGHKKELLESEFLGYKFNISKMADKFKSYVQLNNLGLHAFTAATGYLSAKGFGFIEQLVGEDFSLEGSRNARMKLLKEFPQAVLEVGSRDIKNPLNVMMQKLNLLPSQPFKYSNMNKVKKILVKDGMLGAFTIASYNVRAHVMYTFLEDYQLDSDGNWERGKNKVDFDNLTESQLSSMANKIEAYSNQLEGGLSFSDQAVIQRHAIGSLVMTHKNWVIGLYTKRFRSEGYNYQLMRHDIGSYNATAKFLTTAIRERGWELKKYAEVYRDLPPHVQAGVRRTAYEYLAFATSFVLLVMLNAAIGGDDEDEGVNQHLLYLANRVYLELNNGTIPFATTETVEMVANPFVVSRQVEQFIDLSNLFNTDEVSSGTYKGWSKGARAWFKVIPGLKGLNTSRDPKAANQFLKSKPLNETNNKINWILDRD